MALALGSASVLAIPNPNPETATIGSTEPASQDTSEIVDVAKRSEVVSIEKRDYRACVSGPPVHKTSSRQFSMMFTNCVSS